MSPRVRRRGNFLVAPASIWVSGYSQSPLEKRIDDLLSPKDHATYVTSLVSDASERGTLVLARHLQAGRIPFTAAAEYTAGRSSQGEHREGYL